MRNTLRLLINLKELFFIYLLLILSAVATDGVVFVVVFFVCDHDNS